MKQILIFTLVLSTLLLSFWYPGLTQAAQRERPIVRIIYFVPSNREAQPDIDAKLDTVIKDTQRSYADQMEAHGFDRKTFLFETDASGKAIVHHVNGKFTDTDYRLLEASYWQEIHEKLDFSLNYLLVVLETSSDFNVFGRVRCGYASVGADGGSAVINNRCSDVRTFAHELGHIFGLNHDWRTQGKWIPSAYTDDTMITSFCAAEWLDVHPAFNIGEDPKNKNTTVKMVPPSLTSPDNAIRLRFEVTDPDGLHQVQLITPALARDGFSALADFTGLNGSPNSTVEFGTSELSQINQENFYRVSVHVIDLKGNISWSDRYPINVSFLLPPSEVGSSPDPHSGVAVRRGTGEVNSTHTTWSLPEGAKARLGKGLILEIAYSPNGRHLAVASSIGTWLYDAETYQELSLFTGHTGRVNSVSFGPNGQMLASGSQDGTIRLWDVSTGNSLHTLIGHNDTVESVAFSSDGKTLASASYKSLYLWDISTGNLRHTLTESSGSASSAIPISIASVAFSPDGKTLASATGLKRSPDLWDVKTGKLLHTLIGHNDTVECIAFSPDGKTLASGSEDDTIRLWSVRTGQLLQTLTNTVDVHIHSLAFSPDGKTLASGHRHAKIESDGGTVSLWDIEAGSRLYTLTEHTHYITSVAFKPNGQTLATASADGTLRLWNARTGQLLHTVTEHRYSVPSVAFSSDGRTLASVSGQSRGSNGNAIHFWNVRTRSPRYTFTGHTFNSVSFSPDGWTFATGSEDGTIGLWNVDTSNLGHTLTGHKSHVHSISFSPDGQTLVSGSTDGTIALWDVDTGRLLRPIITPVNSVVFSPNGQTLATTSGYDNNAGYSRGTTSLWDVETGNTLHTFEYPGFGREVAFSPDGKILASGRDYATIYLWDVDTGNPLHTLEYHDTNNIMSVAFSPDGKILASGSSSKRWGSGDATINLWDVNTGSSLHTFSGHTASIWSIAFSPDGQTLASGSQDGTVLLWDIMLIPAARKEIAADVNGDGEVNIQDLVAVAAALGQTGENDADVNGDGEVNIQDLVAVAAALGEVAAAPAALRQPGAAHLAQEEVQHWLTQAQQANLTDATSVSGIRFLEQLLSALIPKETALLPNYPNPFNPETWIPYQLAKPADVTLTIYNIQGRVVRNLDLGHQRAGMYQSKSRAAYWDGRNVVGEPVASGVYFYTFTAGDFTATRKMLIRK